MTSEASLLWELATLLVLLAARTDEDRSTTTEPTGSAATALATAERRFVEMTTAMLRCRSGVARRTGRWVLGRIGSAPSPLGPAAGWP
jgi:hypothetical protein